MRLWTHQHEAISFAAARPAALWDMGMGTGKSRCAIELAKRTGAKRMLVLCPLSVCSAWSDQLSKFGSDLVEINLRRGSVKDKHKRAKMALARAAALDQPCVVVVNYESARNETAREPLAAAALRLAHPR
jgi:SNF2 family DNA or RNA helicase